MSSERIRTTGAETPSHAIEQETDTHACEGDRRERRGVDRGEGHKEGRQKRDRRRREEEEESEYRGRSLGRGQKPKKSRKSIPKIFRNCSSPPKTCWPKRPALPKAAKRSSNRRCPKSNSEAFAPAKPDASSSWSMPISGPISNRFCIDSSANWRKGGW